MTTPDQTGQTLTESETAPETAVRSAVSQETPSEGINTRPRAAARARVTRLVNSHPRARRAWEIAVGDRPSVWSSTPATPAEVFRYAAAGEWCDEESTYLRWAGQAYCLGLAIPFTVAAYIAAWLLQRPARGVAVLVLFVIVRLFG